MLGCFCAAVPAASFRFLLVLPLMSCSVPHVLSRGHSVRAGAIMANELNELAQQLNGLDAEILNQ